MGSALSANRKRLFPLLPSSARYHRLSDSDSSPLLRQPLVDDSNLSMELAHEVQANRAKISSLEKDIRGLNSNFSRLETKVQTSISKQQSGPTSMAKAIEGVKQEAITGLEHKVDNLKKSLDGVIIGREADKRVYSAAFSNQGQAIKRVEEKNTDVEKEIVELKTRFDEMASAMVEMAAAIAELKHESLQPKEAPESNEARIPNLGMMTVSENALYLILIFLIATLIGNNLNL